MAIDLEGSKLTVASNEYDNYEVSYVDQELKPRAIILSIKGDTITFNHIADIAEEVLQEYYGDFDHIGHITAIRKLPHLSFVVEGEIF